MDREKVIRAVDSCFDYWLEKHRCLHPLEQEAVRQLKADALTMLKEQEPVEIEMEGGGSTWWYVCEECRGSVDRGDRFCRHCGRPFKQDTGGCNGCTYKGSEDCPLGFIDSGNFYCPNGKLI